MFANLIQQLLIDLAQCQTTERTKESLIELQKVPSRERPVSVEDRY